MSHPACPTTLPSNSRTGEVSVYDRRPILGRQWVDAKGPALFPARQVSERGRIPLSQERAPKQRTPRPERTALLLQLEQTTVASRISSSAGAAAPTESSGRCSLSRQCVCVADV